MDLVQEIKAVRFTMASKGYDCAAVDSYLAKLRGDLTVVEQERETAASRIADLEQQIADGAGSSETEGTLRRTLLLAQRLADETEQEATAAATEMIDAATAEAASVREAASTESEQTRAQAAEEAAAMVRNAEAEAAELRSNMDAELAASQAEKERLDATMAAEAEASRNESRAKAQAILETAEATGRERVEALELTAQTEAAEMRVPIRAEVVELEGVRAQLLNDIAELETHLEAQRSRVKHAVEALRVGMSGSIEDLERVAEDEDLLGVQPAPPHSGASASDVDQAPDIEILGGVAAAAPEQPTVDSVEAEALAAMPPAEAPPIDEPSVEAPQMEASQANAPVTDAPLDHATAGDDATAGPDDVLDDPMVVDAPGDTSTAHYAGVGEVPADDVAVDAHESGSSELPVREPGQSNTEAELPVLPIDDDLTNATPNESPFEEVAADQADVPTLEEAVVEELPVETVEAETPVIEETVMEEAVIEEAVIEEAAVEEPVQWVEAGDDESSSDGFGMAAGAVAGATGGFIAAEVISDDEQELATDGPITEPIPVFDSEVDDGSIDELDAQSNDLFGTPMEETEQAQDTEVEGSAEGGSFVKRFSEALDSTPIARNR